MTERFDRMPGEYSETVVGGERVRAYLPAPLPPNPPLDLSRLVSVHERAAEAAGRLSTG